MMDAKAAHEVLMLPGCNSSEDFQLYTDKESKKGDNETRFESGTSMKEENVNLIFLPFSDRNELGADGNRETKILQQTSTAFGSSLKLLIRSAPLSLSLLLLLLPYSIEIKCLVSRVWDTEAIWHLGSGKHLMMSKELCTFRATMQLATPS